MAKSLHTRAYRQFRDLLVEIREESGMTQTDLAARLRMTQSTVSKCERGERRLDVIELRQWCLVLGLTLTEFSRRLEQRL